MTESTLAIMPRQIAFSWHGLPQYAAREIRAAIAALATPCAVVGSRPMVPITGMEEALGQPVTWVNAERATSWGALGLTVPTIFFQSGWASPAFNALGDEVRAVGGQVIGLSDANFRGDLRQLVLGALWFRLRLRRRFAAMIVPGASGQRLMRYFGIANDRIFTGMYGADPALFTAGPALPDRPPRFLFVGQLIERKGVIELCAAFRQFRQQHPSWELHLIGSGPLAGTLPIGDGITLHDFVQPADLAAHFAQARFLVLPSHVEAWGLVVHEAALAGCGLLLSTAIGSAEDLAEAATTRFRPGNVPALAAAMAAASAMSDAELSRLQHALLERARCFGPARFAQAVLAAVARVGLSHSGG